MEDTVDKRRARHPDDFIVVVKEFCSMSMEPAQGQAKESVKLLKAMLSRVTGGKEDIIINADETACEATALTLGRDTLWKNTQVEIMRALQKAITISRLKGKVYELQWLVFVNRCIQADILSASHFLLQLHLNDEVLEQDYFIPQQHHRPMDPWDSVHFYALDVIANLVISSFWENPGSKRFLRNMVTSGFFEKLLKIINANSSERFLTTCMAVYIAANVCSQFAAGSKGGPVNKGVVRSGDILNKIAHFMYKENVTKMATEWFKDGVEQFEFDALAERPDGLAVMNTDGVFMSGCVEMSRKKTLQSAINWAVSLQFHSIEYLAAICNPELGHQDAVLKERHIRRSLFRWLRSPIFHSDICILIQSCLRVVSQMADSESAAWTLTNENSFLKQLEYGVLYPNPRAVSLYFEVITKLARFRGKPRELLIHSEVICRAAVLNLYSPEETVNVFALAFLHILVETNVKLFLKHFPLHELSIFRKFMFDKTDSGLSVSDLITGCIKFGREEYEMAHASTPETVDFSVDRASELKDEGNNFFKNNQFPEAIKAYTEAIKVCPPTIKEGKGGKKETMKWYAKVLPMLLVKLFGIFGHLYGHMFIFLSVCLLVSLFVYRLFAFCSVCFIVCLPLFHSSVCLSAFVYICLFL
ncbi:hypothetical protein HOLleu_39065 [Holothuria leucospilota]|uniref:Uncharacterized protein n=1 Tax=Holothuria leucospilota TaxID=206669 RepID=A0A9Q1BBH6_HOLLE|nr:hypothetical protein HOLleu_39065 [Holothuria leucospilota]